MKAIILAGYIFLFGGYTIKVKNSETALEKREYLIGLKVSGNDTATFSAGCFWATEAAFEQIKGVNKVVSGYAGGKSSDASYEKVETGKTGHAETVQVYFDPKQISYDQLLDIFFTAHNPTEVNRQGPDVGTQYRSIIFYKNQEQKNEAQTKISAYNKSKFKNKIATQVSPLMGFYKAEDYHQDYVKHHPKEAYIQSVSMPKINKVRNNYKNLLKY